MNNSSISAPGMRTGCLIWFVGFEILAGIIVLPINIFNFLFGSGMSDPVWFKTLNVMMLTLYLLGLLRLWRGKPFGVSIYLLSTIGYWGIYTIYWGFSTASLIMSLIITMIFLVLLYRDRKMSL